MRSNLSLLIIAIMLGTFSPESQATEPSGWRGDGSGLYPGTQPPLKWSRHVVTPMQQLESSSQPPAAGTKSSLLVRHAGGKGVGHYSPAKWQVLGPFAVPKETKSSLDYNVIEDPGKLDPTNKPAVAGRSWQEIDGGDLNLAKTFGEMKGPQIAYLCAWIHSDNEVNVGIRGEGPQWQQYFHVWIDGKSTSGWDMHKHPIKKGWTRVMLKVASTEIPATWQFRASFFPFADELTYENENIQWVTALPGSCYSMPVLVGHRLFTLSEPNDLICVNASDGKIRWQTSLPVWEAITAKERATIPNGDTYRQSLQRLTELNARVPQGLAKEEGEERLKLAEQLNKEIQKALPDYKVRFGWGGGNTAPTPVFDGKHLIVWLGETGILAKFDLDGKRQWLRFHHPGDGGEHSINASPVIAGNRIIIAAGRCIIAFDRATGDELWRQEYRQPCYSTAMIARAGDTEVLVCGDGSVLSLKDGERISEKIGRHDGECASPIIVGDRFFLVSRGGFACAKLLPGPKVEVLYDIKPKHLDPDCEIYCVGSPIHHDGIIYFARSGWGFGPNTPKLYAIEAATGQLIYRQPLKFTPGIFYHSKGAGIAASLTLAGGNIYILDNRGDAIVCQPGRTYRELSHHQLEHLYTRENRQEVTNSTPIFSGKRIYLRAQENFYCIGE
ncbi:MAG: outer membrane protein assembly factor BamB [Verrucomicrobiales bacterium]|jgi:outer membrane protein assembly factor BamB